MQKILKHRRKLFALFMFIPVTPSIAAITVFSQSVLTEGSHDVLIVPQYPKRLIDDSRH